MSQSNNINATNLNSNNDQADQANPLQQAITDTEVKLNDLGTLLKGFKSEYTRYKKIISEDDYDKYSKTYEKFSAKIQSRSLCFLQSNTTNLTMEDIICIIGEVDSMTQTLNTYFNIMQSQMSTHKSGWFSADTMLKVGVVFLGCNYIYEKVSGYLNPKQDSTTLVFIPIPTGSQN